MFGVWCLGNAKIRTLDFFRTKFNPVCQPEQAGFYAACFVKISATFHIEKRMVDYIKGDIRVLERERSRHESLEAAGSGKKRTEQHAL